MNRTRKSQRSSQEDDDTFWDKFLSPLLKKEKPELYDPDFKLSLKPRQQLELEKKSFNQKTCLSGIVLEELLKQDKETEVVRKRKARKLDSELSQFVSVPQVDSQATDRIVQSQTCASGTVIKALNSSQAASVELRLTTEEASRHEEAITISDDEEKVEEKKVTELDKDEDLQLKWGTKRPKLEDQFELNRSERPRLELISDDNKFDKFIDVATNAHSGGRDLNQSTQIDNIDLGVHVKPNTDHVSLYNIGNVEQRKRKENEKDEVEQLDDLKDEGDELKWDIEDETEQFKMDMKQPKLEDQISPKQVEEPELELSDDNKSYRITDMPTSAYSIWKDAKQNMQGNVDQRNWIENEDKVAPLDVVKDIEIDEDEDEGYNGGMKQSQLDQLNQSEKPGQGLNNSNTSNRLIDITVHSAMQQFKQSTEIDNIDSQTDLNTGSLSWPNLENTKQKNLWMDEEETEEEEEEEDEKAQLDEAQVANLKKVTGLAKVREKIDKEKSHQQLSVCDWNLKTLKRYIKRDQVQLVETLVSGGADSISEKFDNNRFSSLQDILVMRSRQVLDNHQHFSRDQEKGLRLWSFQFTKPMLREQVVSLMALEIIGTACELCDVRMKPEEPLEKNEFPSARLVTMEGGSGLAIGVIGQTLMQYLHSSCKVDFALVHKGAIFGVIEVKTPKTMNRRALVQLLLPLLKLQRLHYEERMQYLGILTDGFRFVFVRLQGEKFTFESRSAINMKRPEEIHIHTAVSWDNLFNLCEYLHSVLGSVTANLLEIAKISSP